MALTWLHLSDLHACNPKHGWDAARVTQALVDDLKDLQAKHGLRPDLIFFTGDAAFGQLGNSPGQTLAEQFDEFFQLLTAVCAAFEPAVPLADVFLVPGNHDVDRNEVDPAQTLWLSSQKGPDAVVTLIHEGKRGWQRYMERLKDYRAFLKCRGFDHLLGDPERLVYAQTRSAGDLTVGIAGFNSAWSCGRDHERGHLWLGGRWQYGELLRQLPAADFRIALIHHPPDWLSEHENPTFGRMLQQEFRFLLHGHEHQPWVQCTDDGYVVASAAACYQRADEENGYNLVRLDAARAGGEAWLRSFDDATGRWGPRVMHGRTDGRGVQVLRLPWLGQAAPAMVVPQEVPRLADEASVRALPAAVEEDPWQLDLERYLRKLRAAHRELPVIGYETQVHLPIRLDEVYIPLTARFYPHALSGRGDEADVARALPEAESMQRRVPFDEVLALAERRGYHGVVVLGEPGSGKTTLLRHFVLAATDAAIGPAKLGLPAATVPVLVELRRLKDPTAGLEPALLETVARVDLSLDATFARGLLRRLPLLVLLDGLDEVADEAQRAQVSRWVEEAVQQLPESRFVVTCRYAGYRGDSQLQQRFLRLDVEELAEEQARRFVADWYRAVEYQDLRRQDPEAAEQAVRAAAEEVARGRAAELEAGVFAGDDDLRLKRLRELARNPLMLQILCLVHRNHGRLPERRVELYRECLVVLLELWRKAKNLQVELSAREAQQMLQPLAWWLQVTERRDAQFAEMLPHLEAPLRQLGRDPADATRLLNTLREQSGALVSLGQGAYSFLHLSLQEYLAACHVQNHPELVAELASHFGDSWWREVTLLVVALTNPSPFEPLMAELLRRQVLHGDAHLANDCLRDALLKSPQPFFAALSRGLKNASERHAALRLLRQVSGWQEAELPPPAGLGQRLRVLLSGPAPRTGAELVERLSRQDADLQVRRLAREVLGGKAPAGERLRAGDDWVHEPSGVVLVYVPGGEYVQGADDITSEEKPVHEVRLSPYWIGKYPVTNKQYGRFLSANPGQKKPAFWEEQQFNQPEQPVVGVDWAEAQAFCAWAGLALPSEAQWEAAARGVEGRKYPWGAAEPTAELANFGGTVGRTTPVDAYPGGAGPFGTLDQAGNVWEWCADVWDANAYQGRAGKVEEDPVSTQGNAADRVVRGGSWAFWAGHLPSACRFGLGASIRDQDVGFRCVSGSGPRAVGT